MPKIISIESPPSVSHTLHPHREVEVTERRCLWLSTLPFCIVCYVVEEEEEEEANEEAQNEDSNWLLSLSFNENKYIPPTREGGGGGGNLHVGPMFDVLSSK